MTSQPNEAAARPVRRALLSVSDKTGLIEFAGLLHRFGAELISTGGTARSLREAGLPVRDVSDVTGFPEIMDGRVKTLHPRIHGALLALRDNAEHQSARVAHSIELIDLVVVNLYPFENTASRAGVALEEVIEQIDIGGPSMIRSAAKNFRDVAVIVSPESYAAVEKELNELKGSLSLATRRELALRAFARTAQYDAAISSHLAARFAEPKDADEYLPAAIDFRLQKVNDLRYGENPHQRAALYDAGASESGGVAHARLLSGKEMSFNNYVDADAAWQLAGDFAETSCVIIKHTNPAGAALGENPLDAYRRALATDPVSAFGGVVAFNRPVDAETARVVTEIFTEVVVAPDFTPEAIEIFRAKKNLRLLRAAPAARGASLDYKPVSGGMLVQTRDERPLTKDDLKVVTKRAPSEAEVASLLFAWTVCRHTKSNAIVYARDGQTVGVGAGQMSRVDSVRIGAMRARLTLENSVVASDAFFPFRDGVDEAARHGITALIQPGGSVRDEEVIAAADELNLAMIFTGVRHFKH